MHSFMIIIIMKVAGVVGRVYKLYSINAISTVTCVHLDSGSDVKWFKCRLYPALVGYTTRYIPQERAHIMLFLFKGLVLLFLFNPCL